MRFIFTFFNFLKNWIELGLKLHVSFNNNKVNYKLTTIHKTSKRSKQITNNPSLNKVSVTATTCNYSKSNSP